MDKSAFNDTQIFSGVRSAICETLDVEESEIEATTPIFIKFDVAVLQYLGIVNRLGKKFGIKINDFDMVPEAVVNLLGQKKDPEMASRLRGYTFRHFFNFVKSRCVNTR